MLEKTKKVGATTVHYKVVLPNKYDPATAYPAVLALGGGPQTMNTVDSILSRNFRAEAESREVRYGTTPRFLQVFGLASLDELPRLGDTESVSG